MDGSEEAEGGFDLFQEPDGYYEKEKEPTQVQHQTLGGGRLTLHLVGHNPLWVRAFLHLPNRATKHETVVSPHVFPHRDASNITLKCIVRKSKFHGPFRAKYLDCSG